MIISPKLVADHLLTVGVIEVEVSSFVVEFELKQVLPDIAVDPIKR